MTLEEWLGPVPPKAAMAAAEAPVLSQRTPTAGPLVQPAILYSNQRDALLAQDAHTASLFATGGRPAGLPPYRETPLAGCTTVLDFARRDVGLDPTRVNFALDADTLLQEYAVWLAFGRTRDFPGGYQQPQVEAYFERLSQCPLVVQTSSEQGGALISRELSRLPSILLAYCIPETRDEPLARLQRLGGSFEENVTVNPFYFSAVREQNGEIYVEIFFGAMWLRRERTLVQGGPMVPPWFMEIPVAAYYVRRLSFRFNSEAWAASAGLVSERHYQSVVDWLASN